jgi:hypothetical protein
MNNKLSANSESAMVAQTSKSAVSRVSKPAGGEMFCVPAVSHDQPTWKSAIQQVGKPALRPSDDATSEFGFSRVPSSVGARASARFNVLGGAVLKMSGSLPIGALKRRERRAPLTPNASHPIPRWSIL